MLDKNMDMDNCVFKYVKYLNLLNKSEATIKSYVSTLQKFVKDEKINEVSEFINMDKEFWFNWVNKQKDEDNISIATINKKIKQMSSFYNFLVNEEFLKDNCLYRFPKVNEKGENDYKGDKAFSDDIIKAILQATGKEEFNCHGNYINLRNKVIVKLVFSTALRIGEMSRIKIEDLKLEDNNKIMVRSKGNKGRIGRSTNCNNEVAELIKELVSYNPNREYLLTDRNFNQLKTQGIRKIWYDCCDIAGVPRVHFHNVRHTIGTKMGENPNITLQEIKDTLGHSTINTSMKYYIQQRKDIQESMEKINIFDL